MIFPRHLWGKDPTSIGDKGRGKKNQGCLTEGAEEKICPCAGKAGFSG